MNSMRSALLVPSCSRVIHLLGQPARLLSSAAAGASALRLEQRPGPIKGGGVSYTLTMNSPPANTFTSAFLTQFIDAVHSLLEHESPVRSVVIRSALPSIFSSGFDLDELSNPKSRHDLEEFLKLFRQAFHCLYTAPFYTVAQISGHAPAGGCALALACDYRVALDSDKICIGLTPTRMGITPPVWLIKLAESRFASPHACERAVLPARLYTPREALALGIVDQLVPPESQQQQQQQQQTAAATADALDRLVSAHLEQVHSADPIALANVRQVFTRQVVRLMSDSSDLAQFADSVLSPECQTLLAKARRKSA